MNIKLNKPPMPGLLWGLYPEQTKRSKQNGLLPSIGIVKQYLNNAIERKAHAVIQQVHNQENNTPSLNTKAFQSRLYTLQANLRKDGFTDQSVCEAFLLIGQAYAETMQIHLYDTQRLAAYYMLNNRLAEMATGEGKTYAVALAAATAALCGVPVHAITANPYLAERDAEKLSPLYKALGLKAAAVTEGQDNALRKAAYSADITYCTAKELAFDYLRDKATKTQTNNTWQPTNERSTFLPGLCMAMIDEADSILIDEASVPLRLSEASKIKQEEAYYKQSLTIAGQLQANKDYRLDHDRLHATLTDSGRAKLDTAAITLPAVWHNKLHREESVSMALAALHLYKLDHHYVVNNGQVNIVDLTTGRIAVGRAWSGGLQQLIELKEGCETTNNLATVTQITYQRFFPKYIKLGGISGTLTESNRELQKIYGLAVSRVPLRIPSKRKTLPMRMFESVAVRNIALIAHVKQLHLSGQPILIATESVQESEQLSSVLSDHRLKHRILNAKHDQEEAQLIANAGKKNAITITTNMAGRGTDIKVSEMVNQLGGIHIISCQVNSSKRVDRQLIGRTARHGQHGSAEIWVTLDNKLMRKWLPNWLIKTYTNIAERIPSHITQLTLGYAQHKEECHQTALRKHLLKSDKAIEKNLAFGGQYD